MTPKEKAKELVEKFIFIDNGERFQIISITDELRAIQFALIAVDECIKYATIYASQEVSFENSKDFLYQVKQEIEKL